MVQDASGFILDLDVVYHISPRKYCSLTLNHVGLYRADSSVLLGTPLRDTRVFFVRVVVEEGRDLSTGKDEDFTL